MRRSLRRLALLAAGAAVVASCGIPTDSHPRDIPAGRQQDLSDIALLDTPPGGSRIYLVDSSTGAQGQLRAVGRDVAQDPQLVLTALLQGPTQSEREDRLRSAIPSGTELLGVQLTGPRVLSVDLSPRILDASGDNLVDAVAQIVYTLSEFDTFDAVQLLVDGQSRQWPRGDGTVTSSPLTIYLYPGKAATTQPDYPALPSPTLPPTTS